MVEYSCKADITDRVVTACRTMMSTIVRGYIMRFFIPGKLNCIVSNSIVLPFIATYVVCLQLDFVSKDVSCVVGFLKNFIKCSLVLRNTHTHTKYKVRVC